MRTITVRKIALPSCEHMELHKIPIPQPRDPGFYRTIISYSAFFESVKRAKRQAPWLFYIDDDYRPNPRSEYEINRDAALPSIQHLDLYAFFTHIGYCRRKKRIVSS